MSMQLDNAQRRVVDHDGGPMLVLGSPGTGKTTVLVERWVHLATTVAEPHRVLLLVPTRERALQLRDELPWRLEAKAIIEAPVHTWHALAYHLVTRYYGKLGYSAPPVRLTTAEQWAVVKQLLAAETAKAWGTFADHLTSDAFVGEVADFCVRAGHRGLTDEDLEQLATRRPEHAAVALFCVRYRRFLQDTATLDYAELVAAATRLLDLDGDIRATVAQRFTHVLVDDAQELAPAQLQLLRRMNTTHLVCAGDPDSAIEAFRGADPTWLERFDDVAPGHDRVVLPICHRFGKKIGDVATKLIEHAAHAGEHRAHVFEGPTDGSAELRCYATMAGELEGAAREMRTAHLLRQIPYDRMALLLAQPHAYGHVLERTLSDFGVPYRIASADRPLGAEPAVRAVLDMCRLALGDESNELCKAVLSSPLIGMHPYRVRDLERKAYLGKTTLGEAVASDDSAEAAELSRLRDAVTTHDAHSADATFAAVFDTSAWCARLVDRRRDDPEAAHHVDALVALSDALAHFVERRSGGTMREYLDTSADAGVAADTWTPSESAAGVHILSFHRSKGLEWDVVCVLGVAEGQMPKAHRAQGLFDPWALEAGSAIDRAQAQLAEERRTFYVALSRARDRLVVSTSPGVRRSVPSRFCDEAFGSLPDPIPPGGDAPPVTVAEAVAQCRRTLAAADATDAEKAAAAAALATMPVSPASWWWRRDWTPGEPLTPEGKLTTSYSRIGRYDECPLRYVLESVLGLDPQSTYQMKFGSLVHMVIERSDPVKGDLKTWADALEVYKNEFVEHHRLDYPNEVFARTYYRYGVQSLKRWWRAERSNGETVEVEFAFDDLDFDGHTIRGRIDRVAKVRDGLVLSDYKTSRNAIAWQEAKDSLQLAIYYRAALAYDTLSAHGAPKSMQLVYPGIRYDDPRDGSMGCAERFQTPEEAEAALARLQSILEHAAGEQFAPSPEADCRFCHMKPLCPRWPEGKEIPR